MSIVETLRKTKIPFMGTRIAVFDTVGSLVLAYSITKYFDKPAYYSLLVFPLGYGVHKIMKIKTPLNDVIDKKISTRKVIATQSKLS